MNIKKLLLIDDESFDCCKFESFVAVVTEDVDEIFVAVDDNDDDDDNDVPEPVTDEATAAA